MRAVKDARDRRSPAASDAAVLLALVAAAFALRALTFGDVFGSDGVLVLTAPDAFYHARRAAYTFARFPSVLFFDPYLNFPDGSPVPWPPLYDFALAATARALGGSASALDLTLAWAAPVLGALTVVPVATIGRTLAGRAVGAAAGAIFAALPISVHYSRVGNPDHHACIALVGSVYLALSVAVLRPASRGRRLVLLAAGLLVARSLMVLSWSGSLLYIAVGEAALLLGAILAGRPDLLLAQAAGALGAATLVAPWVRIAGAPTGGAFSTITLSWFHVVALVGVSAVCAGLAALERRRPARSPAIRAARAVVLVAFVTCLLLAFPAPRRALAPSAAFLTKTDTWGTDANPEARALFGPPIPGPVPRLPPPQYYGWLAYAIPLAMAVAWLRVRRPDGRESAACFAAWTLALGVLALNEVRFGADFAPAASVAFALCFAEAARALSRWLPGGARAATALVLLVGAAVLWPAAADVYAPELERSLWLRRWGSEPGPRASTNRFAALLEFGRTVRRATPETSGYLDAGAAPEYGLLVEPTLGHAIRWASQRAVPADNFGPYLDAEKFALVNRFFETRSEREAVEIAARLRTRYVVTGVHAAARRHPLLIQRRLHADDGSARDEAGHLEHFRLVTEGPSGGRPLFPVQAPRSVPPYKLFEVVEGAVIEVRAAPDAVVQAELGLVTPIGRRFVYRATARAEADGLARLRVPYATEPGSPTRATGPWRVRIGAAETELRVAERDVLEGRVVRPASDSP